MGGPGSGRVMHFWKDGKDTTEESRRLDIRWFKQRGFLTPGAMGPVTWTCNGREVGSVWCQVQKDKVILNYHHGDKTLTLKITLDETPCFYGGSRKWFLCPGCGKRVAVLYNSGRWFFCRHCLDLCYSCQLETPTDRLIRKQRKIRKRLHADDDLFTMVWEKPKGMHWKTFERLRTAANDANALSWQIFSRRFPGIASD